MERLHISYTMGEASDMVPLGQDRLVPVRFTVTVDDDDPMTPYITAIYEVRNGQPQCREIRIVSTDDGREIHAGDGRKLRIQDWMEDALAGTALSFGGVEPGGATRWGHPVEADHAGSVRQVRLVRRQGRRRVTDELLQEVAEVYRANIERNPTEAVAARVGKSHRTAGLYIKQAREAGFLGAAIKGKAGEQ